MNDAEKEALETFHQGEGILQWVTPGDRGFWLYIHTWKGRLFEYIPENDNVEGNDCMIELKLCGDTERVCGVRE